MNKVIIIIISIIFSSSIISVQHKVTRKPQLQYYANSQRWLRVLVHVPLSKTLNPELLPVAVYGVWM